MKRFRDGFALPTVLIASLVMMMVLMTALTATSGTKNNLDDQYYTKLAHSAAEAGVTYAQECMSNGGNEIASGVAIGPNKDCSGNDISGVSEYMIDQSGYRSSYQVSVVSSSAESLEVVSIGYVELLRSSDGGVWKRHTKNLKINLHSTDTAGKVVSASTGTSRACFVSTTADAYCIRAGTTSIEEVSGLPAGVRSVGVAPDSMVVSGQTNSWPGNVPPNYLLHRDPYSCFLLVNDEVYCRGDGVRPWSFSSSNQSMPFHPNNPTKVNLPSGVKVEEMFFSPSRVCFLDTEGDLYCLGRGTSTTPTKMNFPADVKTVVMSPSPIVQFFEESSSSNQSAYYGNDWHACALLTNNLVSCWNSGKPVYNRDWEMPFSTTPSYLSFPYGSTIKQMSSGTSHACFTATSSTSYGNVYCVGAFTDRTVYQKNLPAPAKSVEVSPNGMFSYKYQAGVGYSPLIQNLGYYVCANLENDDIYCWGSGTQGIVASTSDSMPFHPTNPTKVNFPSGVVIDKMQLGAAQACFLSTDKDVYCIGRGTSLTPTKVTLPAAAADIMVSPASGYHGTQSDLGYPGRAWHVCVLMVNGQVSCWNSGKFVYNRDYEMPFGTSPSTITFPSGAVISVPGESQGSSEESRSSVY